MVSHSQRKSNSRLNYSSQPRKSKSSSPPRSAAGYGFSSLDLFIWFELCISTMEEILMNDPDGSVETWQIEFSAGFGALMDDWGQLCEKEELPPKKLMQTQLYARALFKMQIPAIWQLLYESNSMAPPDMNARLRFRDVHMGPTHRNTYMLIQSAMTAGVAQHDDVVLTNYGTDSMKAASMKRLRTGCPLSFWWRQEALWLRNKFTCSINGKTDLSMSDTDASFSENEEFEWTTPPRSNKFHTPKKEASKKEAKPRPQTQHRHIPALQTTPHGRALSPFQIFQRNVNPNAKNVRARLVEFYNHQFTVLSQGVILGDETNQCVWLTIAAALGIDADDFRQDVRHGALAFRASQEKVLDEPQTTCIAELNKPSKMVDLEFLTLFHVKVLADTNIVVLSGSATLTCDIFQHPKKAEESASSSRPLYHKKKSEPRTILLHFGHQHFNNLQVPLEYKTAAQLINSLPEDTVVMYHTIGPLVQGVSASDVRADASDDDDDDDDDTNATMPMRHRIFKSPPSDTDDGSDDDTPLCRMQQKQPPKKKRRLVLPKKNRRQSNHQRPPVRPRGKDSLVSLAVTGFRGPGRRNLLDEDLDYKGKMSYMDQEAAKLRADPDAIMQEQEKKIAKVDEVEAELNKKADEASKKGANRSSKKTLTTRQRGLILTEKWKGEEWADSSGDEATYVIDEIKLTKPRAHKLMVISHHKKSGRVVHEEGEELPYVAQKLGFQCTNTGIVVGKNTGAKPDVDTGTKDDTDQPEPHVADV